MKVFEVNIIANKTSYINTVKDFELVKTLTNFNGRALLDKWKKLEYYIANPKVKSTNFFGLFSGAAFACDNEAADKLSNFFGGWAELLPINLENGTELFIINVTEVANALDPKKNKI